MDVLETATVRLSEQDIANLMKGSAIQLLLKDVEIIVSRDDFIALTPTDIVCRQCYEEKRHKLINACDVRSVKDLVQSFSAKGLITFTGKQVNELILKKTGHHQCMSLYQILS